MQTIPIILSGGSGSRLWPSSRTLMPKPFMEVNHKKLLLYAIEKALSINEKEIVIVTNEEHFFLTKKLIDDEGIKSEFTYILEPEGKNTAPAIALASYYIKEEYGENTNCLILAADHLISDDSSFIDDVHLASDLADNDSIVLFGINPTKPDTGYGYIKVGNSLKVPQKVENFYEKPDINTATKYLLEGCYYWNSGMFFFSAKTMIRNLDEICIDLSYLAKEIFESKICKENTIKFKKDSFSKFPNISIDYAVMEKSKNIMNIPCNFGWSDVGSWDSISKSYTSKEDKNSSNIINDEYLINIDTDNTHIECESHIPKIVATIGLSDTFIIDTPDALLVGKKSESQNVKQVIDMLKEKNNSFEEVTKLPATVRRPWGTYATLKREDGYQVKRITVYPGQKLSLQYHFKRSEHWVVVQGMALVQIGEDEFETKPGEYKYIPLGETHRLTNIGDSELVLIEVQIGSYLGEDDIVRLDDTYGRV